MSLNNEDRYTKMSFFFLDTSAVVKRYIQEHGSAWVQSLTNPTLDHTLLIAEITMVETAAAIAARHRAPSGISLQERNAMVRFFFNESGFYDQTASTTHQIYRVIPTTRLIIEHAANLTQLYRLRGYDAVQLATGLFAHERYLAAHLPGITFVTADNHLIIAAQDEGLPVANPNDYQ